VLLGLLLGGLQGVIAAPGYAQKERASGAGRSATDALAAGDAASAGDAAGESVFSWERIATLPDTLGVAGACAGVSDGALLVAGGANFPEPLFEGGAKQWSREVYALERQGAGDYIWKQAGTLETPRAYGASVTTGRGVVCIGGNSAQTVYDDVSLLRWEDGRVTQAALPDLPRPAAFLSAAHVGETIYVAGGQSSPEAPSAMKNFWTLDLSSDDPQWEKLKPWPGPARILPVAASKNGDVYLFSGAQLVTGDDSTTIRRYLSDAYRFDPEQGTWRRLADMPRPAVGAPPPAGDYGPSPLLILGGGSGADTGRTEALKDEHPGFRHDVLAYHTITDTWASMGSLPFSHVTTPAVPWGEAVVVPSGEVRPGTRSPAVYRGTPTGTESRFGWINYAVLIAYFVLLVGMGVYFSRREESTDDYFLAGGRIPWWAAGISIFGTQLSAITFMAIPAQAYGTNWVYILAQATIVLIAPVIIYFYLPFFRRLNVTTAYEYLEKRFDASVRLFGSAAFVLLQLVRMAIVIFLPAIALSAASGINIYLSILLMGVLSTVYTVLGGIEAVVWSDVLQVVVLMGGALLSLVTIVASVEGGVGGLISTAVAHDKFHTFNWTWDWTATAVWVVVIGNLLGNLVPYTADQTVVQRYLTTSNEEEAAQSIWTNAALTIPAALIFFGLGTALFVFYEANPGALDPALQTDAIFPLFIVQQLPTGVSGLLIAGIFAAAMSSLDSSMNSVATVAVTDFHHWMNPSSPEQTRLRMARWITMGLGVLATGAGLFLATYEIRSLWELFLEYIGLFGGSLAGLFVLGIFTRRSNARGALVGAFSSAVVLYLVKTLTDVHFFLYGGIGIGVCVAVGYLASAVLPARQKNLDGLTFYSLSPSAGAWAPFQGQAAKSEG
jgi:SSS family transporter